MNRTGLTMHPVRPREEAAARGGRKVRESKRSRYGQESLGKRESIRMRKKKPQETDGITRLKAIHNLKREVRRKDGTSLGKRKHSLKILKSGGIIRGN